MLYVGDFDPVFDALVASLQVSDAPAVDVAVGALVGATRHLLREGSPGRVVHIARYLGGEAAADIRDEAGATGENESAAHARLLAATIAENASARIAFDATHRPDDLQASAVLFAFAIATPVVLRTELRRAWELLPKDARAAIGDYQRWNAWAFSLVLRALSTKLDAEPQTQDADARVRRAALASDFSRHLALIGTPLFALEDGDGFESLLSATETARETSSLAALAQASRSVAKQLAARTRPGDDERLRLYIAKSVSPAKT